MHGATCRALWDWCVPSVWGDISLWVLAQKQSFLVLAALLESREVAQGETCWRTGLRCLDTVEPASGLQDHCTNDLGPEFPMSPACPDMVLCQTQPGLHIWSWVGWAGSPCDQVGVHFCGFHVCPGLVLRFPRTPPSQCLMQRRRWHLSRTMTHQPTEATSLATL